MIQSCPGPSVASLGTARPQTKLSGRLHEFQPRNYCGWPLPRHPGKPFSSISGPRPRLGLNKRDQRQFANPNSSIFLSSFASRSFPPLPHSFPQPPSSLLTPAGPASLWLFIVLQTTATRFIRRETEFNEIHKKRRPNCAPLHKKQLGLKKKGPNLQFGVIYHWTICGKRGSDYDGQGRRTPGDRDEFTLRGSASLSPALVMQLPGATLFATKRSSVFVFVS